MNDPDPKVRPRSVRLAVLTFKRPQDIEATLPRLIDQARANAGSDRRIDVVVVDNDPAASARHTVESAAAEGADIVVRYEHEPEPGISAGRNRALEVSSDVDVLIFVDDDERPTESWLVSLLATFDRYGGPGVVGPVVSEFDVEPDAWITAGGYFNRLRRPTGSTVMVAATNNLLLDLAIVRRHGLRFDPAFGISGGGDTMFTRQLTKLAGPLVWCDEAVVYDIVPASRTTRQWVIRRALRSGTSWSATSIRLADSGSARAKTRALLSGRGLVRVVAGAGRWALGVVTRSQVHRAKGVRHVARGAGLLSGAFGYRYHEYKR